MTFIDEWSNINFINLHRFLCFFLALGLKVNLHKIKVYRIYVDSLEIDKLASIFKCEFASLPSLILAFQLGLI